LNGDFLYSLPEDSESKFGARIEKKMICLDTDYNTLNYLIIFVSKGSLDHLAGG